jgi:hypothetical protein
MEELQGITDGPILLTNGEGVDDAEEWHLVNFGRDADFWDMYGIYKRFIDGRGYAYSGGWAEQLAIHDETIELFIALDASVKRPEDGNG